jgi:hypothetical protein
MKHFYLYYKGYLYNIIVYNMHIVEGITIYLNWFSTSKLYFSYTKNFDRITVNELLFTKQFIRNSSL